MKLVQTDRGLARLRGDELSVLDIDAPDLDTVLSRGALASLVSAPVKERLAFSTAVLLPVVQHPGQFVIAGLNYKAHCDEIGRPVPSKLRRSPHASNGWA